MSAVIAFSGASNSGKTTLIDAMKKYCIEQHGEGSCMVLGEVIRKEPVDINKIRQNPSEYLKKQVQWTGEKMRMERELLWIDKPKLVLIDRSLADSLFYISFYIDKSQLSKEELKQFALLYKEVSYTLQEHGRYVYTHLFAPYPIKKIDHDGYRYENLNILQDIEYEEIIKNNEYFGLGHKMFKGHINEWYSNFEKRELAQWVKNIIDGKQ